jgi:hypothetical protein
MDIEDVLRNPNYDGQGKSADEETRDSARMLVFAFFYCLIVLGFIIVCIGLFG